MKPKTDRCIINVEFYGEDKNMYRSLKRILPPKEGTNLLRLMLKALLRGTTKNPNLPRLLLDGRAEVVFIIPGKGNGE